MSAANDESSREAATSTAGLEGATVKLRDEVVSRFNTADYRKFARRTGTVERVFIPMGSTKETARVRWHKRGNRGKEFIECHRAMYLEIVPSHVKLTGGAPGGNNEEPPLDRRPVERRVGGRDEH